jgi:hypothetical protein
MQLKSRKLFKNLPYEFKSLFHQQKQTLHSSERVEKDLPSKYPPPKKQQAAGPTLTSNKVDFKYKSVRRTKKVISY